MSASAGLFERFLSPAPAQLAVQSLLGKQPAVWRGVSEGEEMIEAKGDSDVKDAALIAAAQRVEHYEMAGYGTARNFAQCLGHHQAAQLLQETLDEEKEADSLLNKIAVETVNVKAQHA